MGFFKFKNKEYDKVVTDAINGIDFDPVSIQKENKLYCGSDEINGYKFLNCNIVGESKVRTKNGCIVLISNGSEELEIESETQEINTDFSDTLNLGVTAFVIELDSTFQAWIENDLIQSIQIKFSKKEILFTNFDHEVFKKILEEEIIDDSEE